MKLLRDIEASALTAPLSSTEAVDSVRKRRSKSIERRQSAQSPFENARPVPVPRRDAGYRVMNSAFDLTVASIAVVLLMPLFLVIACAIKMSSPGPVMFRQMRYGLNGKVFSIYKFRTMSVDACDHSGVAQTQKHDPRVTGIGRLRRKTSFDELPQILNILKREMSVVGPRPHVPGMLSVGMPYEEFDSRYMLRHQVRPGLTGLAQVNGYRGETSTIDAARGRLDYDLEYIQRQSIMLDIDITAQTFWKEFVTGSGY